jgi:hypothetical protein
VNEEQHRRGLGGLCLPEIQHLPFVRAVGDVGERIQELFVRAEEHGRMLLDQRLGIKNMAANGLHAGVFQEASNGANGEQGGAQRDHPSASSAHRPPGVSFSCRAFFLLR